MSRKLHELIEDVIATASYIAATPPKVFEAQVADSTVGAILRRSAYKKATAIAKRNSDGTIRVTVALYDFVDQAQPVAYLEYSNSRERAIKVGTVNV